MTYDEFKKKWQSENGYPKIIEADDYHDFGHYEDVVKKVTGLNLTITELGNHEGRYVAYVMDKQMPELTDLIEEDFRYNVQNEDLDMGDVR